MFTDGNCTIIVELIAYLRRAMLGKCFVLFLLISRVTQHDWYEIVCAIFLDRLP